jgi:hypothetical protein
VLLERMRRWRACLHAHVRGGAPLSAALDMRLVEYSIFYSFVILGCVSCRTMDASKDPSTGFSVRVEGEVRSPGTYHLRAGDTIQTAVARAGGLYEWPQESGVRSPQLASVTSEGGTKTNVKRREWGSYRLKAGDNLYINRNWL